MHNIDWISFDHTVPVPVLREGFLISRDDIKVLFTTPENEIRWEKDCAWIQWVADGEEWDYGEAEKLERVEVESVEFFRFTSAPYQFNFDTEEMLELGYTAFFVPGGGIVVNTPDTPVTLAADRIVDDITKAFGTFIPPHLSSWDEYASQVHNMDRVFAFVGVERHEKEKQRAVASRVDEWLKTRAAGLEAIGTTRADQLIVGDLLEASDVRWWSSTPNRVIYAVSAIHSAEDGKLTLSFISETDLPRTLTVPADRRFQKATLTR